MPTVPAAARANTAAGAEAFARLYFERLNFALRNPTEARISSLSDGACRTCSTYLDIVARYKREGKQLDRDLFTVSSVSQATGSPTRRVLDLVVIQEAARVVDAKGRVLRSDPRTPALVAMSLKRRGATWSVGAIDLEQPS